MDWKQFLTAFAIIALAELGDKTQIAVINLSASSRQPFAVFLGGAFAMILLMGVGAFAGDMVLKYLPASLLSRAAAVLFVAIGLLIWFKR